MLTRFAFGDLTHEESVHSLSLFTEKSCPNSSPSRPMPDANPRAPRQGIDAVEVAGAILQALLRCPRPARLKDIELATGIPSAKIHRYLVSMIRCGLVRRHGSSGRYDFGLLAHQVGQVVARDNDVVAQIEARLAQFSQHVGEVVGVRPMGRQRRRLRQLVRIQPEFSIRLKPGMQLGYHRRSATAKLFAAYLSARGYGAAWCEASWRSAR